SVSEQPGVRRQCIRLNSSENAPLWQHFALEHPEATLARGATLAHIARTLSQGQFAGQPSSNRVGSEVRASVAGHQGRQLQPTTHNCSDHTRTRRPAPGRPPGPTRDPARRCQTGVPVRVVHTPQLSQTTKKAAYFTQVMEVKLSQTCTRGSHTEFWPIVSVGTPGLDWN